MDTKRFFKVRVSQNHSKIFQYSTCGHVRYLLEKANIDLRVTEKTPMFKQDGHKPDFPPPPPNVNSSREDDSPEDNMAVR